MDKHTIGFGLVLITMACQGSTQTRGPQPSAASIKGDDAAADASGKPHHGTVSPADKMAPPSGYGSAIEPEPDHSGSNAGFGGMGGMDGGAGTGGFGGVGGVGGVIEPVATAGKVTRASQ